MILSEESGDLFVALNKLTSQKIRCHIAHGCNAQGVMGAGFAKKVRAVWPEAFQSYKQFCDEKVDTTGQLHLYDHHDMRTGEHVIVLNMITQLFPGQYARLGLIEKCLAHLDNYVMAAQDTGFWGEEDFVMAPRIGCGLGGLTWDKVRPIIDECRTPFVIYHL